MRRASHAMIAAVFAAQLPAQIFVVAAGGGPGVNFTSIAAAVAAVPSGAVLDVRPGTYSGFTVTGKSLTILGRAGVRVYDFPLPPIRVDAITAPQRVVLRGLEIAHVTVVASIYCTNSTGAIVIDSCRGDSGTSLVGGRLTVSACSNVHVRNSVFISSGWFDSALQLSQSTVTVTSSTISATVAVPVTASNSSLDLTASTIGASAIAPTVALHQSHLDVRDGCTLVASSAQGAIVAGSGSAHVDPGVILQNAPAQPYSAGVVVTPRAQPWLTATAGALGGSATATLSGNALVAALVIGAPGPAYLPAGISHPAWVLPGSETVQAFGVLPLVGSYAVPNAPWVLGVMLAWQGVALNAAGLELSNPVLVGHY